MTRFTSLRSVRHHLWEELETASQTPDHVYRRLTFGTVREEAPTLRTVILRRVTPDDRTLLFHTDRRSGKVADIRQQDRVAWHGWDEEAREQIRLRGTATVHLDDKIAMELWEEQSPASLVHYVRPPAPGIEVDAPQDGLRSEVKGESVTEDAVAEGRQHFAVVRTVVDEIEWLHLHPDGDYRARFDYDTDQQAFAGTWVIP